MEFLDAIARGRRAVTAHPGPAPGVRLLLALLLGLALPGGAASADTVAVSVPIQLDYPLLRQLLARQVFTGPGVSRSILHDSGDCSQVVLTEPRLAPQEDMLEIHAAVTAQLGMSLFRRCFTFIDWSGSVGFLGQPFVRPGGTSLGLKPQGIWLTQADGERITSGFVWDYARDPVQELFSSFTVDLRPLTNALAELLPDVLPHRSEAQAQATLDSLALADLRVGPDSIDAALEFTVESLPLAPAVEEAILTPEELARWEARWQMMDALLVFAVKQYAAATDLRELRGTLLDILIDSRYQLVDALAQPYDPANDVVRTWFVESWRRLSPVVRRIALQQDDREPLMWISVLAATDALYALDQLGPQIGFDISTDGLKRLARMIDRDVAPDALRYDEAVDPQLQQLFEEQVQHRAAEPAAWRFRLSPFSLAYAGDDRLDQWVPQADEIVEYLPLVSALLDDSSGAILDKYSLDPAYADLFRKLVLATAWQESCWRQYVVEDERIVPLRSATGDVGLMQINERVWRGFYDLQKLRWDIDYNSRAGAEVLLDYLVKYAIKRNEHKQDGGLDNLARASYSAYNGGPSQASRYRSANAPPYQRKVDAAFWKKFQRIGEDDHSGVARCLGAVT